ncbi:tripartite tricarboxylate transporter substrate binding protein [Ramlibacter tataouinensis]|uniref:Candidate extracytoplasmic binding receptor n=1 Tax=Ramlibacter tataouinensis (strain ATCC BAA-407 / DSM 14655 / LMG 21543 / TTB310) TaxID=365046 RepID=F5XZK4_RAMTT|nr:tripartite tricarboxylate transporter substrate binding protein [Ramlibacter tataouinensis]AEG92033.1 Candidate extracytoplasmic binding receptor [Ramlibacter tataouinensis TTB310]
MTLAFHPRRRLLAAAASLLLAGGAVAQQGVPTAAGDWPRRQPIRLVAVFPPGGSVDQVARILAQPLSQQLGQSVVVENRGGASGSIGTAQVASAAPDGYTFAVVFDTHAVNPSLIPNLPFDTRRDLVPLVLVGTSAMVLATHAGSEYKTFADVVAAAKAKKNVTYGSIGSGSLGHLAMALLGRNGGLEWTHVPYKGGGPLMQDAVAGHVPLSIGSVFVTKPHIDSKRLRPLAVTTSKRVAELPEVPTVAESGYPGFDAPAWWALLAPAKTPPEIVQRMNEELNKALKNPDVAARLAGQGISVIGGTPETARTFIDRQVGTWSQVVRDNGIKAD